MGKTVCITESRGVAGISRYCLPASPDERGRFSTGAPAWPERSVQNDPDFTVLFGGGLVEGRGLRAELHVDGLAVDLVGPFEIRAMPFGGIAVAGALRPSALHHALQDGSLQKAVELLEFFLQGLAEALCWWAVGRAARGALRQGMMAIGPHES
jgi:hypothetical protein